MVTINIHKKDLFLLSAIMVFLVGSVYVIAYNSGGPPSVMGHSYGEIGLPTCLEGQILKIVSGGFVCEDYIGFGGAYQTTFNGAGCKVGNPATGSCSCPTGFSLIEVSAVATNDNRGYVCYK